jgi:hypothetical protein
VEQRRETTFLYIMTEKKEMKDLQRMRGIRRELDGVRARRVLHGFRRGVTGEFKLHEPVGGLQRFCQNPS